MANRKVTPTEDFYRFLPKRVQESEKLELIEKNVIATLCFFRLSFSNYAETHNDWFFVDQKQIEEGSECSHATLNRVLTMLEIKTLIQRKSGTKYRCTYYKLHPKIVELLPKIPKVDDEDFMSNETLYPSIANNETLCPSTGNNETLYPLNETLDKNRLDKTSQVKTSLIVNNNIGKNDGLEILFEEEFSKSSDEHESVDVEALLTEWYLKFKECKSIECLEVLKDEVVRTFQPLYEKGLVSSERIDDRVLNRMRQTETILKARSVRT